VTAAIFIRQRDGGGGGSLVNVDLCFAPSCEYSFKIDQWRKDGRIGAKIFRGGIWQAMLVKGGDRDRLSEAIKRQSSAIRRVEAAGGCIPSCTT